VVARGHSSIYLLDSPRAVGYTNQVDEKRSWKNGALELSEREATVGRNKVCFWF
jgi:hypothetical protein